METSKLSMSEGSARFWSTIFGGITAIGLIAAGLYSVVQYFDTREREGRTLQLQVQATALAAKQAFHGKHLELCAEATTAAGTIATTQDANKKRLAQDDFWRLYWGPLGIVEDAEVAEAMVAFGKCIGGECGDRPARRRALDLAHACRAEVSKDFQIDLPVVPDRPVAANPAN